MNLITVKTGSELNFCVATSERVGLEEGAKALKTNGMGAVTVPVADQHSVAKTAESELDLGMPALERVRQEEGVAATQAHGVVAGTVPVANMNFIANSPKVELDLGVSTS